MKKELGKSTQRAFTLIELLAVVAIIAMLVGLMMPKIGRVREKTRNLQCQSRLRDLYVAHVSYINDNGFFPVMNQDPDEGAWAYNYLIWDQRSDSKPASFNYNFGPLIVDGAIEDASVLFCPLQTSPFHSMSTKENPWPVNDSYDTRAGYARRYHLSGRSFSQIKRTSAFLADVFHYPEMIRSAHATGVNVGYSDGHVSWVEDDNLLDNDLTSLFDPSIDNEIIDEIWDVLDESG